MIDEAKAQYYRDLISRSKGDTGRIFRVIDRLLKPKPSLPSYSLSTELAINSLLQVLQRQDSPHTEQVSRLDCLNCVQQWLHLSSHRL